jgi:hypothetical protein
MDPSNLAKCVSPALLDWPSDTPMDTLKYLEPLAQIVETMITFYPEIFEEKVADSLFFRDQ